MRENAAKRLALIVIVACQVTLVVDSTIVNVALPSIQRGLGFSAADLSWVANAYTLAFGGLMLLGGRAGDILGHRRVFLTGVMLFSLASVAGGCALTPSWLLAARAVQGVGAALAGPGALALINTTFDEGPQRSRAIAIFASTNSVAMVFGLVLGGVLAAWTWRATLFVTVPVGIAIVILTPLCIGESSRRRARFDFAGALTVTTGMTLLVYGFIRAAENGWTEPLTVAILAVAAVLLATFVAVESRASQPIVPLWLFRDRERSGAYAMRALVFASNGGALFFLTIYLQTVLGYTPLQSGLAVLPSTVPYLVASRAVPRLLRRTGPKPVMVAGAVLMLAGMAWLTQVSATSTFLSVVLGPFLLFGVGTGFISVAAMVLGMTGIPDGEFGVASGVLQATPPIGNTLGVAIFVTVLASLSPPAPKVVGIAGGYTAGLVFGIGMIAIALLAFRGSRRKTLAPVS
ncbi:MFS transporter [Fodinicola feengrottensis]|uniref:MFS transporter n=1 Tax=Fodinicola feengrottensis TaxID=435914 RepID=UPI0013D0D55C|nr:MFS transporter [Fodinicola feengrottensis]